MWAAAVAGGIPPYSGGPRATLWMYDGSDQQLARLVAPWSTRIAGALRARDYDAVCSLSGMRATNVSGADNNCYFEAKLCYGASRGAAFAAGRVGRPHAAEALRCATHNHLLAARRIAADDAEAALLDCLLKVRVDMAATRALQGCVEAGLNWLGT